MFFRAKNSVSQTSLARFRAGIAKPATPNLVSCRRLRSLAAGRGRARGRGRGLSFPPHHYLFYLILLNCNDLSVVEDPLFHHFGQETTRLMIVAMPWLEGRIRKIVWVTVGFGVREFAHPGPSHIPDFDPLEVNAER